jgi:hypothetical protein
MTELAVCAVVVALLLIGTVLGGAKADGKR